LSSTLSCISVLVEFAWWEPLLDRFTPGQKDLVYVVQDAGWAQVQVWTGTENSPSRDSSPDCFAHSEPLSWQT
jgi:hypothetical protein